MILHSWSNPYISSYLSIYLQVHSFWWLNYVVSFFCPSLMDSAESCISPAWFFFPILLVTWRFGVCVQLQYQVLFRLQFSFSGLGFYELISGSVNCSGGGQGMVFPSLTGWNPRRELWSFIPLSAGSPYWTVKALGSVSNSQSSISLKCVLFYAIHSFVVLFQGTVTRSLCCRAGGLTHPFFQLGSERASASCHRVLQK